MASRCGYLRFVRSQEIEVNVALQYFKNGGLEDDADIYLATFLVALANLPGNLVAAWGMDKIGRRYMLSLAMGLAGCCVFFIFVINSTAGTTVCDQLGIGI